MEVGQLYQGIIAEHNRAPFFYEKRPAAGHIVEAHNPLCGDKFKIYLDLENGKIAAASFHGYGCAVSKASASVLMRHVQGRTLDEARALVADFFAAVGLRGEPTVPDDDERAALAIARHFPGRLQCATLVWEALDGFLTD